MMHRLIAFGFALIICSLAFAQQQQSFSIIPVNVGGSTSSVLNSDEVFTHNDPTLVGGQNGSRPSISFTVPTTDNYVATFSISSAANNAGFDISTFPVTSAGTGNVFNTSANADRVTTANPIREYELGELTEGITYYYEPFGGGNNAAVNVTITIRAVTPNEALQNVFVGTFTEELTACPSGTHAVDGTLIVDGAVDYPIVASKNAEWVVGDDLQLPDWSGLFVRNSGSQGVYVAAAPGVVQDDGTAVNGLSGTVLGPQNPVATQVNGGGGNSVRATTTRTVTLTGNTETRPGNVALIKCVILNL